MLKITSLIGGISIAYMTLNAAAQAADAVKIACTGDMLEPGGLTKSPTTATAVFSPGKNVSKVSIDLGKGSISAQVLSNNSLQLRFRTKEFTGEYFHYTRDLFLIYKSG